LSITPNYYFVLLLSVIVCFFTFNYFRFYDSYKGKAFKIIAGNLLKGLISAFSILILLLYILKASDISRVMMGLFLTFGFLGLLTSKAIIYYSSKIYLKKDSNLINILIVGSEKRKDELTRAINNTAEIAIRIFDCIDIDENHSEKEISNGETVNGAMQKYCEILNNHPINEVIFAIPLQNIDNIKDYIEYAEKVGTTVRIIPDWEIAIKTYKPQVATFHFSQFAGIPTMELSSVPRDEISLFLKSLLDYALAFTFLVLTIPLLLLVTITIKFTSKGPVLFKQERCGLDGRIFTMLKFRTMISEAEQQRETLSQSNEVDGPAFKMQKDPRITWFGKFLRKSSLDEAPQLINILRGEMSLVGPRPPIPSEVEKYEPWQRRRLSMKPGLTCIWQVSDRNQIGFKTWMEMDLGYIDNWSLGLDIKLLLLTIPSVLLFRGV